ncbi:GIGYF family protein Gyf [Drosophila albomicans]|uniref:GIGYF family protein Gyf n=1 Tax=Drosophila albomicans TaxID=7291 RepID=A0A6P8X7S0_DROAB|nr:GIGYF family protein Gyf [Drosophila albomicans]XP_034112221.1 GIGYF family protein Gyf [Drosophila albomicans]XP_034112223.1 GIGYF family protein Gyf [Drosophila albomicans]XP_051862266.1 GIGYF family protein Gyf [Drosophila albomicans]
MTDSMKFGPEWLRNMSAEPSVVVGSSNSMSAVVGNNSGGNNVVGGMNSTSGLSLHSTGSGGGNQSHTTAASRNLFPEYRYGREEMLSLFDRNCLLPQILPSFKKLFVEKVQYPLALTPSSEEEMMNSQNSPGSSTRPAWLQRSASGFGISSRGSSIRVGATIGDRGRMRGKSSYHSIYQRPSALYDDSSLSTTAIKADRNWSERNGIGDSSAVGNPSSGMTGIEWNGTPSSSPRKEFSSHNRNMENWRRNRNEDGSGDAPTSGNLVGMEVVGWRSGANQQRWGRSTSWREEDAIQSGNMDGSSFVGSTASNIQRSISTIGTIGTDRASNNTKIPGFTSNVSGAMVVAVNRQVGSSKACQSQWSGNNLKSNVDGDDNLPEWAMENPSEIGGTFDASGAFHGESTEFYEQIKKNTVPSKQTDSDTISTLPRESENLRGANDEAINSKNNCQILTSKNQATDSESNPIVQAESIRIVSLTGDITIQQKTNNFNKEEAKREIPRESTSTHKTVSSNLADISERFQEVANEVEKLINDDGGEAASIVLKPSTTPSSGISTNTRYEIPNQINVAVDEGHQQLQHQLHPEAATKAMLNECLSSHKPLPFVEQLAMQHHLQQHQLSSVLPPHLINVNPNDLWFYRDPQSNVQGPFSAIEMTEWYRAGYFNENLFVRRFADSRFRALGDLIKLCQGNMPFTHSHLLPTPIDLDNLQIALTSRKPATALNLPSFSLGEQQHHRGDELELKASVTAAANSLSAAIKGLNINVSPNAHSVDTSHMLTMRFQMLQDQYLQHQEYQILSELSKNECFQNLDAGQREAIVRSKVQMLVLPEYLSSFSGLSNSLAALNPIAGNQLYDAIAQQAKKDQQQHQQIIFSNNVDQRPFLDANDFILNAQLMHQQQTQEQQKVTPDQQESTNKVNELPSADIDLLNEYNLRMLLRGPASTTNSQQTLSSVAKPNTGVDFMSNESQLLASQNIIMPMWPQQNQPWPAMHKNTKVTLWDVATLEEEQNQQLLQQQQLNAASDCSVNTTVNLEFEAPPHHVNHQLKLDPELEVTVNQNEKRTQQKTVSLISEENIPNRKDQEPTRQLQLNESNFKQSSSKQEQPVSKSQLEGKLSDVKINEDDRRREHTEEKKRLKEERKRQQQEDDKRRAILAEEEKIRQQQEEKERQQQIQAQRRKALLGNSQATAAIVSATYTTGSGQKSSSGARIDHSASRPQTSSMAPWSLQSSSINTVAPGLAEIQKAERRERRADLQRQQEQLDKQIRANAAAAAEANDALLKWQASPAPAQVMNLVDIQAEEAKRLANELVEQQRRHREHEQHHHGAGLSTNNIGVPGALSNIWGSANKAWSGGSVITNTSSSATSNVALWDDITVSSIASKSVSTSGTSALGTAHQTTHKPQHIQSQSKNSAVLPSTPRNLRKSQTLPVMQPHNVISKNVKAQVHQMEKTKIIQNKPTNKASSSGNEDKKLNSKSQQNSSSDSGLSLNKSIISDYENEFTIWCMKSLDNMSAKVDVPTFVTFLQDLEAPYEVKDYVRIYLGEGKDSSDFVKQFLERRSKYKSLQRAQNAHNDDMCKPAPAITPSNDNSDNKNKQKKIKKSKMTKMDARILGFSVTAAEGRINVGSRDYVDGP